MVTETELTQIPFLMLPEDILHGNFYFKVQKTKISTLCLCLASLGISSLSSPCFKTRTCYVAQAKLTCMT